MTIDYTLTKLSVMAFLTIKTTSFRDFRVATSVIINESENIGMIFNDKTFYPSTDAKEIIWGPQYKTIQVGIVLNKWPTLCHSVKSTNKDTLTTI